jgi:hypothetical protein
MVDTAIASGGLGAASARASRLCKAARDAYAAEGERRLLWLPVCFGAGIALYFSLTFEPPLWLGVVATLASGVAAFALHKRPYLCEAALAITMFCAGFALIGGDGMAAPSADAAAPSWAGDGDRPGGRHRLGRSRLARHCRTRSIIWAATERAAGAAAHPYRCLERRA